MTVRHCIHCGTAPLAPGVHPKCKGCGEINWTSPKPVAVAMVPMVGFHGQNGLLVIQRGIYPFRGQWALPSGFVEQGESAEDAALRELEEEAGISLPKACATISHTAATPEGQLLVFVHMRVTLIGEEANKVFRPSAEALAWGFATPGVKLCFDLHAQALNRICQEAPQ